MRRVRPGARRNPPVPGCCSCSGSGLPICIELTGFEPATSSSRTKRATSLRYSSLLAAPILHTSLPLASKICIYSSECRKKNEPRAQICTRTGNFFRFVRVCSPGRAAYPREATGRHAGGWPAVSPQYVCAPAEVEALPFLPGRVVVQFTVVPESHFIGREVELRHFFPFPRIAVCTWL